MSHCLEMIIDLRHPCFVRIIGDSELPDDGLKVVGGGAKPERLWPEGEL